MSTPERALVLTLPEADLELGAYVVGRTDLVLFINDAGGRNVLRIRLDQLLPLDPERSIADIRLIPEPQR